MDQRRRVALILAVFLLGVFLSAGCGGGGGGSDVVDDESGIVGVGADGVTIFWQYYTGENFGIGNWAEETGDGGYIMVGTKSPALGTPGDLFLFKTDDEGTLQWERPYPTSGDDWARVVRKTGDGGYLAAGYTGDPAVDTDNLLIKTDSFGAPSWMSTWDNGSYQEGQSVWPAAGGGYLFLGNSFIDHPGNIWDWDACMYSVGDGGAWAGTVECFGGANAQELAYTMEEADDGGYIVAGTRGAILYSIWLVKTDQDGHLQWQQTYGEGTAYAARAVDTDGDGAADDGFIIAGKDANPSETGSARAVVIRTDAVGGEIWRKYFGGAGFDCANGIALAGTSGVVVAGQTDSFSAFAMLYLLKLDMDGNVQWQKVKGKVDNFDMASSVREAGDGGFILAAGFGNMLVKTDKNGDTVNLGSRDVTLNVPTVSGLIDFSNATEAAAGAVDSLLLPWNMGYLGLEWLLQVLDGAAEADICDVSLSGFAISPAPTLPLSAGDAFQMTFTSCSTGAFGQTTIFNGVVDIVLDSLAGTFSSSGSYQVQTRMTTAAFGITDDVGTLTIAGGVRFARAVTPGGREEYAQDLPPGTLSVTDGAVTRDLSDFGISASDTGSGLVLGSPGESVLYSHNGPALMATITMQVQEALVFGPVMDDPVSGALSAAAPDNSAITVNIDNGSVDIAVDADGDGSVDGTIGTSWEALH